MGGRSQDLVRSVAIFALLIAGLVAVKSIIDGAPELFRSSAQAAVFSWLAIAIFAGIGLVGTVLSHRVGLPGMWNANLPLSVTLFWPVAIGVALGALAIVVDSQTHWAAIAAEQMKLPSIHIAFPASVVLYAGGALVVSIIYFLAAIPLVTWLSSLLFGARGRDIVLWVASALAAAIEPGTQDAPNPALDAHVNTVLFASDYVLNLAQARFFVSAGFVPAVVLRVAFYGVWHVLWGYLQGV